MIGEREPASLPCFDAAFDHEGRYRMLATAL